MRMIKSIESMQNAPVNSTMVFPDSIGCAVRLSGVRKSFGAVEAVKDVNLEFREGTFTSLLGPSGCGKTTLLRLIAGLETVTTGEIQIGGQNVGQMPIHKRNIGLVFQNYALFPHKTIGDNIAFGLKHRGVSRDNIKEKVQRILAVVRLPGFEDRYPSQLSGGQQQRIALARAVVFEPAVLLLDEPLSALDANLREEMRVEIKMIHKALGLTTILVTHDQQEALAMSDEVAIMNQGCVQQVGAPRAVYQFPRTRFVAEFLGYANAYRGSIIEDDAEFPGQWVLRLDGDILIRGVSGRQQVNSHPHRLGDVVDVVIRGSDMRVESLSNCVIANPSNGFIGQVEDSSFLGDSVHYLVQTNMGNMKIHAICRISEIGSDADQIYPTGTEVRVSVPPEACAILPIS